MVWMLLFDKKWSVSSIRKKNAYASPRLSNKDGHNLCVCVCARVCIYIIYIIHIALIKIGDAGCRQNGAGTAAVFSFTQNIIIKITTTTTTTNNNG
jgi:hypothetical protein